MFNAKTIITAALIFGTLWAGANGIGAALDLAAKIAARGAGM